MARFGGDDSPRSPSLGRFGAAAKSERAYPYVREPARPSQPTWRVRYDGDDDTDDKTNDDIQGLQSFFTSFIQKSNQEAFAAFQATSSQQFARVQSQLVGSVQRVTESRARKLERAEASIGMLESQNHALVQKNHELEQKIAKIQATLAQAGIQYPG